MDRCKTKEKDIPDIKIFLHFIGENMYVVMDNFVKEYMVQIWQEKDFRNAAVKILCCICDGKKFASKLEKVKESPDTLKSL